MKVNLELNFVGDTVFLNFWNGYNGRDVICEIIAGEIFMENADGSSRVVSMDEYCSRVKSEMDEIQKDSGK